MKKSVLSRRDFMKGIAAGTISTAFIPAWTGCNSEQTISLPKFVDCNKYIGPGFPQHPDFPKISDLLAHMDRLGIDRAVVWHTSAKTDQPMP